MKNLFAKYKKEKNAELIFYSAVFCTIAVIALLQPLSDPPDEVNRFKIPQFICNYGTLPRGDEFEVAIGGYGGSYAYQPMLPYMVQGIFMRFLTLFTDNHVLLLLGARFVNVCFGVIMAVYVRKLAKALFHDSLTGWLFSLLIMFLPQNLFLHSYVNTDSMASMSGAVILYACVSGWKSGWNKKDCLTLCAGISLCALSYYNAYGLIAAAMLLFAFSFWRKKENAWTFDFRSFLNRGLFISAIVLLCISWWFIRSYIIHDGDFLGLAARIKNASLTALPEYNPLTRATLQGSGIRLTEMLFQMDFFYFLWNSFVARFGPMTIPTYAFLYPWYYRLFYLGWAACLLPLTAAASVRAGRTAERFLFHTAMLTAVLIPIGLCIYYSYTSDYQPQGRYIMPMLIPFMYFITLGLYKLGSWLERLLPHGRIIRLSMYAGILLFLSGSLFLTVFGKLIPYYLANPNLSNAPWVYF